ncbi:hypothetical protein H5U98_31345 [Mycolicibacterium boenickei]|uniref:Anti-sigma-M factor RsmA n=1 Tax=Mycolicibacterium boenickei TaxID=146017 RepID=A0AAX2ZXI6_9MYCO|nr:hypothetical protein [Mycolicibacterium boenickei]PEG58273.1 hypothetical protein CQY21_23640 [Mycolicibacterium boenickei]UNB99878.1 hypothetical protein H5U98_31345 [Mycolicibacterium boenickei]BBX89564.1 hypothetical protein MBOE_12130 [Mycolicibacterium boenickei]
MNGSTPRVPSDGPIPAELLADLQAGLLDDTTAADVRRRVRTDPLAGPDARNTLAALDRVRRDLRELGADSQSAPPVPAEVSARLTEALRAEPAPRTPPTRRWKSIAAVTGAGAAVVAAVLGGVVLTRPAGEAPSARVSLGQITVSPPRAAVGLSEAQILGLLSKPPDLGPLADAKRRTACLTALGYSPGVRILGAQPVEVAGQRGVLVLMPPNPPDTPESVVAVALAADCDAGHAGSLAQTVVKRPARHP